MSDEDTLTRLKHLHTETERIRRRLSISSPNSIIFRAPINPLDDEEVIVEADRIGGARLSIVEGNYGD